MLETSLSGGFWSILGSYSAIYILSLTNIKWHSDPWPGTVTSEPIRLFTNSMTLIPSLIFSEKRLVFMKHVQRVWHASRRTLILSNTWSPPFFETGLCSNCWDQLYRTFRLLVTFHLEYTLVLAKIIKGTELWCRTKSIKNVTQWIL